MSVFASNPLAQGVNERRTAALNAAATKRSLATYAKHPMRGGGGKGGAGRGGKEERKEDGAVTSPKHSQATKTRIVIRQAPE